MIVFSDCKLALAAVGDNELSYNAETVLTGVRLTLSTTPGTRPMLREYGCDLVSLLFEPLSETIAQVGAHRIDEALQRWNPEVKVSYASIAANVDTSLSGYRFAFPVAIPALGISVPFAFRLNR